MESKAGSILLLISGILTILGAAVLLVVGIVSLVSEVEGSGMAGVLFFVFFAIALVFGILKLWTSGLMKKSETTTKGGVIALILGILSGGDLLAIIGGILGIVQGGSK